jgi:simple sugar transport system permease protein
VIRRLGVILARALPPLTAVAICLLAALLSLAWLGFGREEGQGFAQRARRIARVVWQRSLLPSPPPRRAPRPGDAPRAQTYRSWIQTLVAATPILLTGLAVALAFRASVLNIGAEGQYIAGAIAAVAVGLYVPARAAIVVIPALLAASLLAGAAIAAIAALLEHLRRVPIVLSTLLLNFVAIVLLKALLQGPLHEAGQQLQSEQLPERAQLPHVFLNPDAPAGLWQKWAHPTFQATGQRTELHLGLLIALASALLLSLLVRYTTFGFRLRATGENPTAARFAGIPVARVAVATLCLSGGLAGLAGGIQLSALPPYQLLPDTGSSGFGFTGIAVALLGRLSPFGVVLAALFFGWLRTAFAALESEVHVPFLTLQATQGAILIAMLMLTNLKWVARLLRGRQSSSAASPPP